MDNSDSVESRTTAEVWQERYGDAKVWSGNPNAGLVEYAGDLEPGTALELGCGEGADAIWLAQRGWQVTGVDVSATALARGEEQARARGLEITWVEADLADWRTEERFDLVTSFFLHSPVNFPRAEILKAAADAVTPGGVLLIVGHADFPPWSRRHQENDGEHGHAHGGADSEHNHAHGGADSEHNHRDHAPRFPSPSDVIAEAQLDGWEILAAELSARAARGADGKTATIRDSVLKARRPVGEKK